MRRIGIIGADEFGFSLALELVQQGVEVLLLDRNHERVQRAAPVVAKAVAGDAMDKAVLAEVGFGECDVVVVTLGDKVEQSVTATLLLKELKVRRVIAKASSEVHGKILSSLGADQVLFPDGERARRFAKALAWELALDYTPLSQGLGIIEMGAPWNFCGKSLGESKISENFGVTILLLLHKKAAAGKKKAVVSPGPEETLEVGDRLIVFGPDDRLEKLAKEA